MESSSTSCMGSTHKKKSLVSNSHVKHSCGATCRRMIRLAFKSRMEQKAPCPHHQVSDEGNEEDRIMFIPYTTDDALDSEPYEHQVRQGVDDLGGVDGSIVVLYRETCYLTVPELKSNKKAENILLHTSSEST